MTENGICSLDELHYYIIITIVQSYTEKYYITSLLPSVLLRVRSMSNNANSNKRVIFFSGIAWYYGDNDFIIRTFDFIACSDAACVTCST